MSVHDPESSAHEKAIALKLGRQKKIQIIDGQQVEVIPGEEEDEEDDIDGSMMEVESDGQQYVVLEVIQLQVTIYLHNLNQILISCYCMNIFKFLLKLVEFSMQDVITHQIAQFIFQNSVLKYS